MTIGQRIAERRKMLGISQENLGERLGVSRQAISKWESDGAIPEIDKLIGLSKLFGVSVGWLLGTESDVERDEQEPEQREGLSDEQLNMVEQIVLRYQQAQQEPKRNQVPLLVCLVCAIAAIVLSVVALTKTNRQYPDYDYQLNNLTNSYSSIRSQLYDLSSRLDELAEGEKLLSEYDADISALPDWKTAGITFRALPKNWKTGDSAYISIRQNGAERYKVDCAWDGVAFSAETQIPYGEFDGYFVLCGADGSQIQQNISDVFYGLPSSLEPVFEKEIFDLGWDLDAGNLTIDTMIMWVEPPWIMAGEEELEWTKLDLVVKYNGRELGRADLLEVCEDTLNMTPEDTELFGDSAPVAVEPYRGSANQKELCMLLERYEALIFELPEVKEGDRVEIVAEGGLSNGYTFTVALDSYVF